METDKKTLREYFQREEFGIVACCEISERQLNHILSDVIDWLSMYRRGQVIPESLLEIGDWIGR